MIRTTHDTSGIQTPLADRQKEPQILNSKTVKVSETLSLFIFFYNEFCRFTENAC